MASAELVAQDKQSDNSAVADLAKPRSDSVDWKAWGLLVLPLLLCGAGLAIVSDGNYQEDDIGHYLIARQAWESPELFLDVWGRPGFTIPYALVGWLGEPFTGLLFCRLLSLSIALATAALTTATARRLRIPHAEWAGLITFLIPLYFQLSFATLTETICGLYLMGSTYLLVSGRPKAAALVLSLTMLTRHEAIVFVVGGMILFFWRREWIAGLLVWAAEAVWNAATALTIGGRLPWFRYQPGSDMGYGTGSLAWGLLIWVEAVGPVVLLLTLWGSWELLRRIGSSAESGSLPRGIAWLDGRNVSAINVGRALIVFGALGTVLLNTLLYMFNKFASGGYARFLVPAVPSMAICALAGVNTLLPRTTVWFGGLDRLVAAMPLLRRTFVVGVVVCFVATVTASVLGANRYALVFIVSILIAPGLLFGGGALALIGVRFRQHRALDCGAVLMTLAWPVSWSAGALPLRQTASQRQYADACNWIREQPRLSGVAVASMWPTGGLYIEQYGFPRGSIWETRPTRKLVLEDASAYEDLTLRRQMERTELKELARFPPSSPGPTAENRRCGVIVYEATPRVEIETGVAASRSDNDSPMLSN